MPVWREQSGRWIAALVQIAGFSLLDPVGHLGVDDFRYVITRDAEAVVDDRPPLGVLPAEVPAVDPAVLEQLLDELTPAQRQDEELISGCVAGALLKDAYLDIVRQAGFRVHVLSENADISKQQYQGIPLESVMVEAVKE